MKEKYLPIGTVVTVPNVAKKVMITGYYAIEYQNAVKIYDYEGCVYPEGSLAKNSVIAFNHSDITNVDYMGYEGESFGVLNNILKTQQTSGDVEATKPFVNLQFDENGVVVYEELSDKKVEPKIVKNFVAQDVKNPFEMPSVAPAAANVSAPIVNNNFTFDANGVVLEDNTVKENTADIESNFRYEFDANGVVLSETPVNEAPAVATTPSPTSNVQYQFDANGVVVGEIPVGGDVAPVAPTSGGVQYQFDENGVVIGENPVGA